MKFETDLKVEILYMSFYHTEVLQRCMKNSNFLFDNTFHISYVFNSKVSNTINKETGD